MLFAIVYKLLFSPSKNQLVVAHSNDSLCLWKPRRDGRGRVRAQNGGPTCPPGRCLASKSHFALANLGAHWPLRACFVVPGLPPVHRRLQLS